MSLLRTALLSNALFSATTGFLAIAAPQRVTSWLGSVPPGEVRLVGFGLVLFAAVVAIVARAKPIPPLRVLAISAADLGWVAATAVLLLLFGERFDDSGRLLTVLVAVVVGTFAVLQLEGLARQYRHPDRDGEFSHRLFFDVFTPTPAAAMWEVVSDLGSVAQYNPTLKSSRLEGAASSAVPSSKTLHPAASNSDTDMREDMMRFR